MAEGYKAVHRVWQRCGTTARRELVQERSRRIMLDACSICCWARPGAGGLVSAHVLVVCRWGKEKGSLTAAYLLIVYRNETFWQREGSASCTVGVYLRLSVCAF